MPVVHNLVPRVFSLALGRGRETRKKKNEIKMPVVHNLVPRVFSLAWGRDRERGWVGQTWLVFMSALLRT